MKIIQSIQNRIYDIRGERVIDGSERLPVENSAS